MDIDWPIPPTYLTRKSICLCIAPSFSCDLRSIELIRCRSFPPKALNSSSSSFNFSSLDRVPTTTPDLGIYHTNMTS